jgi:hypothetical protein
MNSPIAFQSIRRILVELAAKPGTSGQTSGGGL